MRSRLVPALVAFILGACTTAAVQSSASSSASDAAVGGVVVTSVEETPVRVAPSGKARVFLLARGESAFVGKLEMDPGAAVPEHRDATEEYIHVLSGSGVITIEGQEYSIEEGSTVFMPAGALVRYRNGDEPLRAIQVFAGPGPADKYQAWQPQEG